MGFGIVGKVGTTSADSQVHKADSTAEPIRHGQTAGTPQGIYGENTAEAVRTFQKVFNLPQTGVVDYPTWYRISDIYVGVSRIAELS